VSRARAPDCLRTTIACSYIVEELDRRLRGVRYESLLLPGAWRTRFQKGGRRLVELGAARRASSLDNIAYAFQPQLVLTVAYSRGYCSGVRQTSRSFTFVLIVHDDWPRIGGVLAANRLA
jgi:hypothetical protein